MKKSILRITCFVVILCLVLISVNRVLKVKYGDGIYSVTTFYEQKENSVDVLILGSSHAYQSFNTGLLWDEYGMASYIMGGSLQPMWNTYYYLKEALKTQRPQLIVLEGYLTTWGQDYLDDKRTIKNIFGLRWSRNKWDDIKISSPEEQWGGYILEYTQYHTRYAELSKADFFENQGNPLYENWKGFGCNMETVPMEAMDVSAIEDKKPLYEKTEEYYRRIIELAQENGIPIVVVVSPYAGINEDEEAVYNMAADIASEYGVDFINCNLLVDEIGIDYATDAADHDHLNYKGNQKFSHYIGQYLKDNFVISDRGQAEGYDSWEKDADYISQMIYNQELLELTDIPSISTKLLNEKYRLFITVDGSCTTSDENLQEFFAAMDIEKDGSGGMWYRDNTQGIVWYSGMDAAEVYIETPSHDFCMRRLTDSSGSLNDQILVNNVEYKKVGNGVNVVVYDTVTETIVDCFGINMDHDYQLLR